MEVSNHFDKKRRLTSSTASTWNNFLLYDLFSSSCILIRQTFPSDSFYLCLFAYSSDSHKSWHEVNKRNSVHGQGKVEGNFCVFYGINKRLLSLFGWFQIVLVSGQVDTIIMPQGFFYSQFILEFLLEDSLIHVSNVP